MNKKWLLMMMTMMTAFIIAACGAGDKNSGSQADDGSSNADKKVLKVGMEAGYAPFNWTQQTDANGAVKISGSAEYAGGYDVQIAKKIADGLGMELEIIKMEWDGLVPAVQSGVVDAIIAGMSPTEKRKESIDFTSDYYTSDFVVVMKKGNKYENAKTLADLAGAKITSQLNTSNYLVIDQIPGVKKEVAMDSFPAMRVAVESGAIDGYVAERPEAISAAMANDKFTYTNLEDGFETDPGDTAVAIGVRKGYELTDKMSEIIASISQDDRQKLMEEAIASQPAAVQ